MRLIFILMAFMCNFSILFSQNEIIDRLNKQSERIIELEKLVNGLERKVVDQDEKIADLKSRKSTYSDRRKIKELEEEIANAEELIEDTQKTLELTKEILDEEVERRKRAEEREGIAVEEARKSALAAQQASYSANQAARGRDQAIKDTERLVNNGNGFVQAIPYNQRGKYRGGSVIVTITPKGDLEYTGFRSNGKVDYLFVEVVFRLMNKEQNDGLEHVRGMVCLYNPSTQKFIAANSLVMNLADEGIYYKTYKARNPFMSIGNEVQLKEEENFIYMFVENAVYNEAGFSSLTATDICQKGKALFTYPADFCEGKFIRP